MVNTITLIIALATNITGLDLNRIAHSTPAGLRYERYIRWQMSQALLRAVQAATDGEMSTTYCLEQSPVVFEGATYEHQQLARNKVTERLTQIPGLLAHNSQTPGNDPYYCISMDWSNP